MLKYSCWPLLSLHLRYHDMLKKAKEEGSVVHVTTLWDSFFEGGRDHRYDKPSVTHIPYLEGDYWPGEAENLLSQIQEGQRSAVTGAAAWSGALGPGWRFVRGSAPLLLLLLITCLFAVGCVRSVWRDSSMTFVMSCVVAVALHRHHYCPPLHTDSLMLPGPTSLMQVATRRCLARPVAARASATVQGPPPRTRRCCPAWARSLEAT
jgi:hypothetical protein